VLQAIMGISARAISLAVRPQLAIRATSVRMRLGRPNLLAGLRLSWTSDFHACRRDRNPDAAAALDRALQEARHSHLVDQRINLRERRGPVLRHDDILWHVE